MSKFEERMNQVFDLTPTGEVIDSTDYPPEEYNQSQNIPSVLDSMDLDSDLKEDYIKSRDTLEDIIEKGKQAIEDMLAIARDTEIGRNYEILGNLIKNVADTNEKLMDLQKDIREVSGKSASSDVHVKNAIFVGSTNELQKMIKGMKNVN